MTNQSALTSRPTFSVYAGSDLTYLHLALVLGRSGILEGGAQSTAVAAPHCAMGLFDLGESILQLLTGWTCEVQF